MSTPRVDVDFSGLLGSLVTALSSAHDAPNPVSGIRPGGFPEEIFSDLSEQEKRDWECSICYLLVRGAKRCANNHLFCSTCILTWALSSGNRGNGRKSCPVCRLPGHYKQDFSLDRKLARKYTKCLEKGCDWTGRLREYSEHCRSHGNPDYGDDDSTLSTNANTTHGDEARAMLTVTRSFGTQAPSARLVRRPQQERVTSDRTGQSYSQLDTRIRNGRHRLEHLFASFNGQLEQRGRDIQRLYNERESQRVQQLQEVNDIGQRLNEVSSDLMYLLGNMNRDSDRYRTYIRQTANIETAIQELSDSVAAIPLAAQNIHTVSTHVTAGGAGPTQQVGNLYTPRLLPAIATGPATPRLLPAMDRMRPAQHTTKDRANGKVHSQVAQTSSPRGADVKMLVQTGSERKTPKRTSGQRELIRHGQGLSVNGIGKYSDTRNRAQKIGTTTREDQAPEKLLYRRNIHRNKTQQE